MGRIGLIAVCCFTLGGCAMPLGIVAAGLAGGAATEASSRLGRDAGERISLWLMGDEPPPATCEANPAAEGCEPEALLTEYLKRTTPEQRQQIMAALPPEQRERLLAALPPELREQMEAARAAALPAPAYGAPREPRRAPPIALGMPADARGAPPPYPIGPLTPAAAGVP